jgi:hypothetical protein
MSPVRTRLDEIAKVCKKCGHAHMWGAFCGLPCECDRSKETRLRYDWNYVGGPLVTNERRKGERRRGYRYEQRRIVYRKTCLVNGNLYSAVESRSGEDRRK